jgi:DNA-binding response OmpR family regulator
MAEPVGEDPPAPDIFRILLVDDDDDDAGLFGWSMSQQDLPHRLERVATLEEGLTMLGRSGFDVVLLDLHLPGVHRYDGIVTFRRQAPDALVIVLTGLADAVTAAEAVHAGADDYVVKSIDADAVCQSIRAAWERKVHAARTSAAVPSGRFP